MTSLSPINGIPRPDGTDPPHMVDQYAAFVNVVDGRLNPRFFNAAARDAAIPMPTEGMRAYLESESLLTFYDGTTWAVLEQPRVQRLNSNFVTTSLDHATITDLTFNMKANSKYLVEYDLSVLPSPTAPVGNTCDFSIDGPVGSSSVDFFEAIASSSATSGDTNMVWSSSSTAIPGPHVAVGNTGSSLHSNVKWVSVVTTAGTPGSLTLRVARLALVTSVTVAATQSFVRWTKLS